jgi:hypothetical protein
VEQGPDGPEKRELKDSVRKLTNLLLQKLEEDVKAGAVDQPQIRLVSAIVLKAFKFWEKIARDEKSAMAAQAQIEVLADEAARVLGDGQGGGARIRNE